MTPFFFGASQRRLFGLYRPSALPASRGAVVLCHPLGAEYIHAHRAVRQLALRLSEAGFDVLRFDYFGTGDSGGDLEDVVLGDFVADIGLAVDELCAMSGASRVRLVGLRFGALLAARAAAQLGDRIDALVLWDPVVSGADHLSEFLLNGIFPTEELLHSVETEPPEPAMQGFPISAAMADQIRSSTLQAAAASLPRNTFVVLSDEKSAGGTRAALTAAGGRAIPVEVFPSFPCWFEDWPITLASVPVKAIARIVSWLADSPALGAPSLPPPTAPAQRSAGAAIAEEAVRIGIEPQTLGILAAPPPGADTAGKPALLVINTGIAHRVGHFRILVLLSRKLAQEGHVVLRFDLSGIGDSERRDDSLHPIESARRDILEAVDFLEARCGQRRVVLFGLCSGADNALVAGGADPRVVGTILIDPSIPPTPRYYLNLLAPRMVRWRSWLYAALHPRRTVRKIRRMGTGTPPRAEAHASAITLRHIEARQFLRDRFAELVQARDDLMVILTGGFEHRHNYRSQLLDAFPDVPFGERLSLTYLHDSDHLFSTGKDRARLFGMVQDWLARTQFRAAPEKAAPPTEEDVEYF